MQELSTEIFNVFEFQPVLMSGMKHIIYIIYIDLVFFQHPSPAHQLSTDHPSLHPLTLAVVFLLSFSLEATYLTSFVQYVQVAM